MADQFFFVTLEPSLTNPQQFAEYACNAEALLQQLYPPYSGYRVQSLKPELEKTVQWRVSVWHGWSSGVLLEITPDRKMPHIARVSLEWHSRVKELVNTIMTKLGAVLMLIYLAVGIFFGRLLILLIASIPFVLVYAAFSVLTRYLVAKLVATVAGDSFNDGRRAELLDRLRQVPAPKAPSTQPLATASFAGNVG